MSSRNCDVHTDALLITIEFIPGRLYFSVIKPEKFIPRHRGNIYYCTTDGDPEFDYTPFCSDFGPLNLSQVVKFSRMMRGLLAEKGRCVCFCSGSRVEQRANAAFLMGCYSIMHFNATPARVARFLEPVLQPCERYGTQALKPFEGFRDALPGPTLWNLSMLACLAGMHRAWLLGWIDVDKFEVDTYEHYEKVENGDLNWIVPGKILAFAGPHNVKRRNGGYQTWTPEDYLPFFKKHAVGTIVRLNKRVYDRRRFLENGVNHHDLFFPDGGVPGEDLVYKFLALVEREGSAFAVHCKAGLGRTGTLNAMYLMKHYHFSAEEAIAYTRVTRPGSIVGPQQQFCCQMQGKMWAVSPATDPIADRIAQQLAKETSDTTIDTTKNKTKRTDEPSQTPQPPPQGHRYNLRSRRNSLPSCKPNTTALRPSRSLQSLFTQIEVM